MRTNKPAGIRAFVKEKQEEGLESHLPSGRSKSVHVNQEYETKTNPKKHKYS